MIDKELNQLVRKLDKIWAKVEAHDATTSWGREQSKLLIQEYVTKREETFANKLLRWYWCLNDEDQIKDIIKRYRNSQNGN